SSSSSGPCNSSARAASRRFTSSSSCSSSFFIRLLSSHVLVQLLAQLSERPVRPSQRRSERDFEHGCNLLERQLREMPQQDNLPVLSRQLPQAGGQPLPNLQLCDPAGRLFLVRVDHIDSAGLAFPRPSLQGRDSAATLSTTCPIAGQVRRNPKQP